MNKKFETEYESEIKCVNEYKCNENNIEEKIKDIQEYVKDGGFLVDEYNIIKKIQRGLNYTESDEDYKSINLDNKENIKNIHNEIQKLIRKTS
jgi:hypothetical protein